MPVSPLNKPVNVHICQGKGTIFSTSSGEGGGSTPSDLTFSNLGSTGAAVYAGTIDNNVQFRRLIQGVNARIVEQTNGIEFNVDDLKFDSTSPIKRAIPGLQGVVLGKQSILQAIQELLYPIVAPNISLSTVPTIFEIGDSSQIVANFNVIRTDEVILTISVAGQSITPNGSNQAGSVNITKNGQSDVIVNMQVTTATKSATTSQTVKVSRKIRLGFSSKDGTIAMLTDNDLNSLIGLTNSDGTPANGVFNSTGKLDQITLVGGQNQYLVICIPNVLNSTPLFRINGFLNNAFTKVRNNAPFTNTFGYSDNCSVWVSNSYITGTILFEID